MSDDLIQAIRLEAEERMEKALTHAKAEFATVRTGRAAPAFVERIPVEYYGSTVPLQQLASFSVPEARMLIVTPFDKGAMGEIETAIRASNLGLSPSNDGSTIRLAFPPLTEERRKEFVRVVRAKAEEGRTTIRAARRDARKDLETLEKDGDISENEFHRAATDLDNLTKEYEKAMDDSVELKTEELLEG